eukprot:15439877-Alexandrium_andersonii.AAC.1
MTFRDRKVDLGGRNIDFRGQKHDLGRSTFRAPPGSVAAFETSLLSGQTTNAFIVHRINIQTQFKLEIRVFANEANYH